MVWKCWQTFAFVCSFYLHSIRGDGGGGLTFVDDGHLEGDADDAHQVAGGDQGAQDGADAQGLPLPLVDEL